MKYILLLSIFILTACHKEPEKKIERADWQDAPHTHQCTDIQIARVQSEAKWCNDNTSYFSSYCYGSALVRNCIKSAEVLK